MRWIKQSILTAAVTVRTLAMFVVQLHRAAPRHLASKVAALIFLIVLLGFPAEGLAQSSFAGVYTGTFSGPAGVGEFAILVRTNNIAIVMAFDAFDELGFVNQNVTINPNGSFSHSNIDGAGTSASGTLTSNGITGTFVASNGATGTLNGTKQPATGFARDIGGFYSGPFSWPVQFNGVTVGAFSGNWFDLIAANGTFFELIEGTLSVQFQGESLVERIEAGGLLAVNSLAELCQSVNAGGFSITCTFNPSTFTFSGSIFVSDSGVTIIGSWSVTRREPLPDLPPVAVNDGYTVLANRSLTVDAAEGVLANDSDPEGDPLTALFITSPTQGELSSSASGAFTYTPNRKFVGADSFTYRAQARSLQSNVATVTITVESVKAMPWLGLLLLED